MSSPIVQCILCSPVLTPADDENHVDKVGFKVPFVCGARNLGEALRRIAEGASMIRTKGEAGTGKQCVTGLHDIPLSLVIRQCSGSCATCPNHTT